MTDQLQLKQPHLDLLWKRKTAVEAKFKVQLYPLFAFRNRKKRDAKNGDSDFSESETCVITLVGQESDIAALKEYVNEVFVKPELVDLVSYHHDLEVIFKNDAWIEVFEELYNICITEGPDCELTVCGSESSVSSVVAAIDELTSECKDILPVDNETSLAPKLVTALGACKKVYVSTGAFEMFPNSVIELLLSLLERACKDSFPESWDDSVVIIDPPEKEEKDVSLIVLDSDSDDDSSSKRPLQNSSCNSVAKEKPKKLLNGKKKKRSRALENVNGLQGGDLPSHSKQKNGRFQCPKVKNGVYKKIGNPNFIPLNLNGANNSSLASRIPPQQAGQSTGEVKVQSGEAEVVAEVIPVVPRQPRPIVIDGCNVAFYGTQGRREDFSWKHIEMSLNYFLERGHDVKVFLPQARRPLCYEKSGNQDHVENLENRGLIIFTPSRRIDGRIVSCYDDRFIVDLASRTGGVIFSNDNYRDLIDENSEFSKTIKERLLMYVFAGNELMIPDDPLGKNGPRLGEFLTFPAEK